MNVKKRVAESAEHQMLLIRCEKLYFSSNLKVRITRYSCCFCSFLLNVSHLKRKHKPTVLYGCAALHVYSSIIFRTFFSICLSPFRGMKEFGRSF